jgi:hypothetical protein
VERTYDLSQSRKGGQENEFLGELGVLARKNSWRAWRLGEINK